MIKNGSVRQKQPGSPKRWAVVVFSVGLLIRLLVIAMYQPVSYSDTPSYRRLAEAVLGGFTNYDGTRTPGYPVFMAMVGNDQRVWIGQLFLGLLTSLLLFYIGWRLTAKPWFGGVIGLAHTLNLGQLFFESDLLTESLTTFLLVLTLVGVLLWLENPGARRTWLAVSIGLASTLSLLVRPLFIYLPFYILIFLIFGSRFTPRTENDDTAGSAFNKGRVIPVHPHWKLWVAFLLPVILLLGGWVSFIHAKYGDWALTTMTGYHLIQHTGSYFEYVPDEYASLRDTYIKYRDEQVALTGTQTNAIWEAIPEMSRVSEYNFYDLSRVLAKISVQLILEHPVLFLKNALQGWWLFWRTAVYWSADALRVPRLAGGISAVIQVERAILFVFNLIFIFASTAAGICYILPNMRDKVSTSLRFTKPTLGAYFWFLAGTIWIASILQTLLDHGDNPRFLVPLQSVVVLWVAVFILQITRRKFAASPHRTGEKGLNSIRGGSYE